MNVHARLWHPWLRIERQMRVAIRAHVAQPPSKYGDDALAAVLLQLLVRRREVERAGWFN